MSTGRTWRPAIQKQRSLNRASDDFSDGYGYKHRLPVNVNALLITFYR